MQRMDVSDILLVCLAGDVEKGVKIGLNGLSLTPFRKNDVVTFTAYAPHQFLSDTNSCWLASCQGLKGTHFLKRDILIQNFGNKSFNGFQAFIR